MSVGIKSWYLLVAPCLFTAPGTAQETYPPGSNANLALQLTNPIASLISVPIQNNFDFGLGANGNGSRYLVNIQPVVPVSLNRETNLLSRTILPFISQSAVTAPGTNQTGLGDVVQSLFLSPKAPTSSGLIWGAGPVLLLPTATNSALGAGKWGIGPTGVALKIVGQSTFGLLANHIWSYAGNSSRADVSATFVQPFYSFTTPGATSYGITAEFSHDWGRDVTVMPITASVSQVMVLGKRPVSIGGGVRYFIFSPTGAADWGLRFNFTLLFPR
jgi:hypothetical protein